MKMIFFSKFALILHSEPQFFWVCNDMAQGNTLRHWFILPLTFPMQNKGPKYDVSTTACCPLCDDDIQVGMAGPQGLDHHQGNKCLATITKKKEEEWNWKNLTLFSFLQRKGKGKLLSAVEAAWDAESQNAESSSHVIVHPISMRPISALEYTNRNWGMSWSMAKGLEARMTTKRMTPG